MKYSIFLVGFFLHFLHVSEAHSQVNKQVKIVMKNGVRIKGAIVKTIDVDRLEVDVDGSQSMYIRYDLIKTIQFKNYQVVDQELKDKLSAQPSIKIETFYHEIRGSLLFGEENIDVGLHSINGYQFNQYLGTGLGLGVNKFGNYLAMPIYANVKGYIYDRKVSPFYFGDIGYGYAWNTNKNENVFEVENVKGGLYWQLGLGYQFNFYSSSLILSMGYVNQHSKADYVYYRPWDLDDVEISESRVLRRFNLSIGFLF